MRVNVDHALAGLLFYLNVFCRRRKLTKEVFSGAQLFLLWFWRLLSVFSTWLIRQSRGCSAITASVLFDFCICILPHQFSFRVR